MRFANLTMAPLNDSNIVSEGGQAEEASGRQAEAGHALNIKNRQTL